MNINNIPDKLYKEIIDKDGQKIVFDLDLEKTKDTYIKLQNKYNQLKEDKEKKKPFKILINILFWIFCIVGIIAFFNSYLLLSFLLLVIALIIIIHTEGQKYAYGNPIFRYSDTEKYRDVNMHPLDIMGILELEEKMVLISEINALDESYISKINIYDDNNDIDFLYIDKYQIPHTMQIVSNNTLYGRNIKNRNIYYRNIDYISIENNVYNLDITLPLKYSEEYKKLVN